MATSPVSSKKGFAPVNQLPGAQKVLEGQRLLLSGLRVTDADAGNTTLSVTLSVTHGSLQLEPPSALLVAGLTVTYSNNGSRVVVSGSQSQINEALGRLTYTPSPYYNGADTLTMTSSDRGNTSGTEQIDTDTLAIAVLAVNDAPTARDLQFTMQEDTTLVLSAKNFNFSDVDKHALAAVKIISLPSNGALLYKGTAINASKLAAGFEVSAADLTSGKLTFVPAKNAYGQGLSSFQFQVRDNGGTANGGKDTSSVYTATIHVNPVNDGPVAVNDAAFASTVLPATGQVLFNDTDLDNDRLSVTGVAAGVESPKSQSMTTVAGGTAVTSISGKYGVLSIKADGSYTYVIDPKDPDYKALKGGSATENFTYTVSDGNGGSDKATLAIKVTAPNRGPVAQDDSTLVLSNTRTGKALANDTDPDADQLVVTRVGALAENSNIGRELQPLTTGLAIAGKFGSLTMRVDGSYSYLVDPKSSDFIALSAEASATDSFTYEVSDGRGGFDRATITVTVKGENDNPVAIADSGFEKRAGNVLHNTAGTDYDVDGDTLLVSNAGAGSSVSNLVLNQDSLTATAIKSKFGTLLIKANGDYTYTVDRENPDLLALDPAGLYTDVFSYVVSDGKGGKAKSQLTINFRGPNTPPVALDDTNAGNTGRVLANDTDQENNELVVSAVSMGTEASAMPLSPLANQVPSGASGLTVDGVYGTLTIKQDGSFTYHVNPDDPDFVALGTTGEAVESFVYEVKDIHDASDRATLSFNIDQKVTTPTLTLNTDIGVDDAARTFTDKITADSLLKVGGLDADATWEYRIDSGDWKAGSGSTLTLLEGTHTYQVRQTDVALNQALSEVLTTRLIVDPSSLGFALVDTQNNALKGIATSSLTSRIEVTSDADTLSWQYRMDRTGDWINGDAFVNGKAYLGLAEGQHLYETRKLDVVGNTLNQQQRFTLDTKAEKLQLELKNPTSPGITSEPLATVKGMEGRAQFEMRVDDQPEWSQVTLDHLQFKLLTGTHTYYLRQTDAAGNVSEVSEYTATYVSAIPQPGIRLSSDSGTSKSDGVTNVATIVVDGLAPGATWEYQIDGIDGPWLAGNANGTIAMISDGQQHDYAVRQKVNGQYSEPSELFNVVADIAGPNGLTVALNADTGNSGTDNITKDPVVNIAGLEVGASLEISIDGSDWISQSVTTTSTSLNLTAGEHSYRFRQIDKAGNISSTVSQTYTYLDALLAAPTLALVTDSGIDDNITTVATIRVTLDKPTPWQYRVDEGEWIDGQGDSFNAVAGQHVYAVRQSDAAGNELLSQDLTVVLDNHAPVFTSARKTLIADSDSERQKLIGTDTVLYTVKSTDAVSVQYSMEPNNIFNFDSSTGNLTFKDARGYSLTESNLYPVTFVATDIAGNASRQTVSIEVTRTNTSAPAINLAEVKSGTATFSQFARVVNAEDGNFYVVKDDFNPDTDTSTSSSGIRRVKFNALVLKVDANGLPVEGFTPYAVKDVEFQNVKVVVTEAGVLVNMGLRVHRIDAATGQQDMTWGDNGELLVNTFINGSYSYFVENLNIASNGQVFASGRQSTTVDSKFQSDSVLESFDSNGKLISSYHYVNDDGKFDSFHGNFASTGGNNGYTLHSTGHIGGGVQPVSLVHIKEGVIDTRFGTDGFLRIMDKAYEEGVYQVRVDHLGRVLTFVTNSADSSIDKIEVKRYSSTGEQDMSFGSDGKLVIKNLAEVELDGNGGFYFQTKPETTLERSKLGHVTAQGALDTSFGVNGYMPLSDVTTPGGIKVLDGQVEASGRITVDGVISTSVSRFSTAGVLDASFGDVALTLTEGNRPIGLLNTLASIADADAADINNYAGVTIKLERADGANDQDVFSSRGKLRLAPDGSLLWDNVAVGTFTNEGGSLQLAFNAAATQEIADGVTRSVTYTNISQQPTAKVLLKWTVNDHDPAGAKTSTAIQTINITDDLKDVGDAKIVDNIGGLNATLNNYIQSNGKNYYLLNLEGIRHGRITSAQLDTMFNSSNDTTTDERTFVAENGTQYKLPTLAEINALLDDNAAVKSEFWKQLSLGFDTLSPTSGGRLQSSRILSADLGNAADQHKVLIRRDTVLSNTDLGSGIVIVEVDDSGVDTTPAILVPGFKLEQDNGESVKDLLTSNPGLRLIGFETAVPYEYSLDGGTHWTLVPAGGNLTIQLPDGTYLKNSILARQTDLSGFTTTISNSDAYKIDTTPKSFSLANDQGLRSNDLNTADGRVVLQGLDTTKPYEYSVNGGKTYVAGGFITVSGTQVTGFLAPQGIYEAGAIRVRQVDDNQFVTRFRSTSKYVVDPVSGQGTIALINDNGDSTTDFLSSDGRAQLTGLRFDLPYEYSVNGGSSWQSVAAGGNLNLQLPEGLYELGSVLVRQADPTGFVTQLSNPDRYNIDKTVRSLSLLNDQGISSLDSNTADGRVVLKGFSTDHPFMYSLDSGLTYVSGSFITVDGEKTPAFTLPTGEFAVDTIRVKQTISGFTTTARNTSAFIIDPLSGQGSMTLSRVTNQTENGFGSDNGSLVLTGLRLNLPYEYSVNGGSSWQSVEAGGNFTVELPEGLYEPGSVLVKQADATGFVTELSNSSRYNIDKTVRSIALLNDQGLSLLDRYTADGRVVLNGFSTDHPFEYSLDGGLTYVSGSFMTVNGVTSPTFLLPTGVFSANMVSVKQTISGFTSSVKNSFGFVIDPLNGQGSMYLRVYNSQTDNGFSSTDDSLVLTGLRSNLPYEYSVNGGSTWQSMEAGGNMVIRLPEGIYELGSVLVKQTDATGFVTQLSNSSRYNIDKTVKSISLLNDQGISTLDLNTADGRVVLKGFNTEHPFEYSLDGGSTYVNGSYMTVDGVKTGTFTLPTGEFAADKIRVKQTISGFTSSAKNFFQFVIDPLSGQGSMTLKKVISQTESGFSSDDDTLLLSGLRLNLPYEYSVNGGNTWQSVGSGGNLALQLPEGLYERGSVLVRQTDDTGFVTQLSNASRYKIDKTVRTADLANDQGLSNTDRYTADGRVVLNGFDADRPYEYSLDGGKTFVQGGKLMVAGANVNAFNVPDGFYYGGQIHIRQVDADGFTITGQSKSYFVVDPVYGQGRLALVNDTGRFYGDNVTKDGTIEVTGLKANLPWKYSFDGGATWIDGVASSDTRQRFVAPEGQYAAGKILLSQTDASGYTSIMRNKGTFIIDQTPAGTSIALVNDTGYSNTDGVTADGTIRFEVTGLSEGDIWSYTTDRGKTWIDGQGSSQTLVVGNGEYPGYQFNVWAYDLAGNVSQSGLKNYVVVNNTDTKAPVFDADPNIKLIAPSSGEGIKNPYIVFRTQDVSQVYYSLSGRDASLFTLDINSGRLTYKDPNGTGLKLGDDFQLSVNATDAFGNSTDQAVTLKVFQGLKVVSKTVASTRDKLGEGVDQVIKFNQNIVFNPKGKIEITYKDEDYNSTTTVLDVTDTSKVVINGDTLTLKGAGFSATGRYYIGMSSGVMSADSGVAFSVYEFGDDGLGFTVSSKLEYFQGFVANNAPIVSQIDATTAKLGKDGAAVIIGDVNGDGIDDWASSYTLADGNGRTDSGKIYVAFGRADGLMPNFASIANGNGGFVINGAAAGDQAGDRLSGAGDVNGDGFADILIKATAANGGNGKAYVVFGKAGTGAVDLASVEGGSGGKYYTNNVKHGLAALGDINNDGFADIAHARTDLTRTSSWTQVTYGATSTYKITTTITQPANYLALIDVALDVGVLVNSIIDDPFSGAFDALDFLAGELQEEEEEDDPDQVKIAILKDNMRVIDQLSKLQGQSLVDFTVNKTGGGSKYIPKDTVYEVVYTIKKTDITTTRYTQTLYDVGEVQVEYGSSNTQTITGNVNGTGFGSEIAALGDINGDGFADYVITEQGFSDYMPKTSVIFGTNNKSDFFTSNLTSERHGLTFIDPRMTKNFVGGGALTALGDVNGDGINDFAVGFDSSDTIDTYVVYGKLGLSTINLSDIAKGIGGYKLREGLSRQGTALVTAIGDYNGDGLDDFVVTRNSQYASTVQIYYGSATGKTTSEYELVKSSDGFQFYISGADGSDATNPISAGDINGDGLTDLLVRTEFNGNATFLLGSTTTTLDPRIKSDNIGTANADTLTASGGDLVLGLAGNDTITVSGANVVQGGLGNDRILIDSSFVTALQSNLGAGGNTSLLAKVDGGAGIDILQLTGSANLDLSKVSNKMIDSNNISGRLDNIEIISLGNDATANTLTLRLQDVLEMGNKNVFNTNSGWANVSGSMLSGSVSQTQMVIDGTTADTVQLRSGEWSLTTSTVKDVVSNEVYKVYVSNTAVAQLYIDADIKVL